MLLEAKYDHATSPDAIAHNVISVHQQFLMGHCTFSEVLHHSSMYNTQGLSIHDLSPTNIEGLRGCSQYLNTIEAAIHNDELLSQFVGDLSKERLHLTQIMKEFLVHTQMMNQKFGCDPEWQFAFAIKDVKFGYPFDYSKESNN